MSEESNSNEIPQSEEWPLEDLEWFKQQIPADLTGATGASEGSLDALADPLESISATDHESLGDTSLDPKPSTPTPQRVEHQTASDAGGTEPPGGLQSPSDSLRVTSTSGDDKNAAEAHLPAIQESSDASTQLASKQAPLNALLVAQLAATVPEWLTRPQQVDDAIDLYQRFGAQDGAEIVVSALTVGLFNATMDGLDRAARPGLKAEVRHMELKLSQSAAAQITNLIKTLQTHRGLGAHTVSVGSVNLSSGANAIVGNIAGRRSDKD
jgi:hypothetical protein